MVYIDIFELRNGEGEIVMRLQTNLSEKGVIERYRMFKNIMGREPSYPQEFVEYLLKERFKARAVYSTTVYVDI